MKLVVALGGNAIGGGSYNSQLEKVNQTCRHLVKLIKQGHKIIITHGNGPQVGNILLQQKEKQTSEMPLDVCGAMSQAQIGYMFQQALANALKTLKIKKEVVTVITQVLVDKNDMAFKNPTKPIGPFYKSMKKGCVFVEGKGYRKAVASPIPRQIIELKNIEDLIKHDNIVISCGGGGVPITQTKKGYKGVEAVIDKDRCAALLARQLKADMLLILTDVKGAYLNFESTNKQLLRKLSVADARKLLKKGEWPAGSMAPKVEACADFAAKTKKKAVIADLKDIEDAVLGKAGTVIK